MSAELAHLPGPTAALDIPTAWALDPELRPADLGTLLRIVALLQVHDTLTLEQIGLGAPGGGITATRAAVDNLTRLGYLDRSRLRTTGRFRGVAYKLRKH